MPDLLQDLRRRSDRRDRRSAKALRLATLCMVVMIGLLVGGFAVGPIFGVVALGASLVLGYWSLGLLNIAGVRRMDNRDISHIPPPSWWRDE